MRRLLMFVPGLIMSAAVLAASAGAVTDVPSGDTCSITGTGTTYTAVINIPANGTEQGAFAFGAPGGTVTNAAVVGGTGTVATTSLPAGTNLALKFAAAVPGASVTASLTTSGPIPGSFTVVPSDREGTTWFDPLVCQHPKAAPTPSNKFTARRTVTYNAKTGTWREVVTVPARKLIYAHRTLAAKGTPKPLVWSGRVPASKAGRVTLTLKPTPSGRGSSRPAVGSSSA